MSAPLRLLFLADPSMASRAVGLIEQHSPVAASLATDSNIFRIALRDERWDGVLVLPGNPVLDIEVARIYAESKSAAPLVVVGSKVPDALRQVGASTVALSALGALAALLRTVLAGRIPTVHVPSAPAAPTPQPPPTPGHPDPEATAPPPPSRPSPPSTTPIEDASVSVASSTIPDLDELATSRDAIETLADHLPVGIYRTTPDGRVLYANPAFAGILEVADAEQATRLDVRWDLGYPRDAFEAGIRDSGEVRNLILTWTTPSGRRVHTRENARVVRTARGRVLYYEGTIEDVTEEIERAARERLRTRLFAAAVQFYDAANSAQTTGELHRDVVHAFQEAFEADWAVIVRPVKGRNRIVVWPRCRPMSCLRRRRSPFAPRCSVRSDLFTGFPIRFETSWSMQGWSPLGVFLSSATDARWGPSWSDIDSLTHFNQRRCRAVRCSPGTLQDTSPDGWPSSRSKTPRRRSSS